MDDRTRALLLTIHAAALAVLRSPTDPSLRAALLMALGAIEEALGLPRTFATRKDRRADRGSYPIIDG